MAYKCLQCGHIFEEGEQFSYSERIGDFWGVPTHQDFFGCPICKGDCEKTVRCKICGGEFLTQDLKSGACSLCLEDYRHDFDICHKISEGQETKIEINSLIVSIYEPAEIEQIVIEHIKNHNIVVDCKSFIEEDEEWFAERLVKEVNKQ